MVAQNASTRTLAGRYRLGPTLGTGANAKSFDALDLTDDTPVVVKMLPSQFGASESFMERFTADLAIAARLDHPNIVRIRDFGVELVGAKSYPFVVTSQLSGGSLRGILDRGRTLSASQALVIGIDVCRGLAHAHAKGLTHGAITPSNILFDADRKVQIADFGISRLLGDVAWSDPGRLDIDLARYASPEQALGLVVEPRSDVYSLALTLVESVTGQVPFAADTTVATLSARLDKLMPVSADLGALASVLERAGRPAPEDRFSAVQCGRALIVAAENMPRPEPIAVVGLGRFGETAPTLAEIEEVPESGLVITASLAAVRPDRAADEVADRLQASDDPIALLRALPDAPTFTAPERMPSIEVVPEPSAPAWESVAPGSTIDGREVAAESAVVGEVASDWEPEVSPLTRRWSTIETVEGDDDVLNVDRRRLVKYALLAAALVVLAVIGIVGYRTLSTPSPVVPNLIGLPQAQASNLVAENGWTLEVRRVRDDAQAQGDVVSTDPAAGERLKKGSTLVLVVSDGATLSVLPDVTGLEVATARDQLTAAGLTMREGQSLASETVPAGAVISWSVSEQASLAAGSQVPKGTTIDVVVSSGSSNRTVPDLVGRTPEDAAAQVDAVGLVLGATTEEFSNSVEAGHIVSSSPGSGATATVGESVSLVVSKGKDLVVMPKVIGKSLQEATDALTKVGLVAGSVTGGVEGTVSWALYPPGDKLVRGTAVAMVMLAPPPTTTTTAVPAPN